MSGNDMAIVFSLDKLKMSGETAQEITPKNTQEKIVNLIKQRPKIIELSSDGVKYHSDALRRTGHIRHVGTKKKQKDVFFNFNIEEIFKNLALCFK